MIKSQKMRQMAASPTKNNVATYISIKQRAAFGVCEGWSGREEK